jgi:hypothetical protein
VVTHFVKVKFHNDASLISINPHMHLLGKYFISYAVTPDQDTIPLIEVKDWDFNWQDFYRFKHLVKIPAGSIVYAKGIFDNTAKNLHNPFQPPQDVYFERGMDDTDEMLRMVILYLPYQEGDEDLPLE